MDKQSYKEMLEEEFSRNRFLEKEISRLQILVTNYSDKENKIKRLVYDNPNDFGLGGRIRWMYRDEDKKSDSWMAKIRKTDWG